MTGLPPTLNRIYPSVLGAATRHLAERALGERYLSRVAAIDQFWALPEAARDERRDRALHEILEYARRHVPAYAESPGTGWDALTALPVVDKQDMIGRESRYLSDEHASLPAVEKHTGGSTGDPWNYPLDRSAWAHSYAIQIHRFRELGFRYGDARVTLGFPTSLGLQGLGWQKRFRLVAERTDVSLCGFEVGPAASRHRAIEACRKGARFWYGYASTIAAMAAAALEDDLRLTGPALIVTMAEPLWPGWKTDIENAFGSRVVEEYGCNDGGIMSYRCDHGNLHLADHQSIVEVLDPRGEPCAPGEDGEIVITNFHARHLPFIRYRVGDIGAIGPCPCPCGQPGRTLARVSGRTGDFVRLPDGTELSPVTFFNPFNEATAVRRWQMVQPDPEHLLVRVDARTSWSREDEHLILSWITEQTGDQLDVALTTDEPLELTSGGKHKVIVREFA